jgi:hypothetical protein
MKRIIGSTQSNIMKRIIGISFGIVTAALLTSVPVSAQVTILSQNFDSGLSASESFAGYHGGDATNSVFGISAGTGTGGSSSFQNLVSTAANGNGYAYAAAQLQEKVITGNTSANLSDYTLSFDAMSTAGSLNLQIQTWSGANFGGTQGGTLNTAPTPPGYGNDLSLSSSYQHYSLNLGNATIFPASAGFLTTGGTWQIAWQLNGGGNGVPSSLTFNVDNVLLTMTSVPEPSTLALAGLGAVGGLLALRRRKA